MKLLSVNVGLPQVMRWKGQIATSGIFKQPVAGRVKVHRLNLEGDRQADLSVHGGLNKAVYAYPAEHYAAWKKELPDMALPWGMFGENFTVTDLLEDHVHVGDRFRIGTADFIVTQPRLPCYKLAMKFQRNDIIKKFLRSGRSGFYLAVLQEGEVGAGDDIQPLDREENAPSIAALARQYASRKA